MEQLKVLLLTRLLKASKHIPYNVFCQLQNRTEGKIYCENFGMKLAKIETIEELNFLNSKYQQGVFSGCRSSIIKLIVCMFFIIWFS